MVVFLVWGAFLCVYRAQDYESLRTRLKGF
jgi:hypothetical protein